jgi:hypothetical protein
MCSVVGGDRKERSWEKPTSRADGGDDSEGDVLGVVREENQEVDESKKRGYREYGSDLGDLDGISM